jgi:hypothetical protein
MNGSRLVALFTCVILPYFVRALRLDLPVADDTWSKRETKPKEPMMVFVHFEKVAGSFLKFALEGALPERTLFYHDTFKPIDNVPANYFVVAGIRNPCTQAVSHWSYLCEKAWAWKELQVYDPAAPAGIGMLLSGTCPTFSGKRDEQHKTGHSYDAKVVDPNLEGFAKFTLQYPSEVKFALSAIGFERVNCWINYESMEADAKGCLEQFQNSTGSKPNWQAVDSAFHEPQPLWLKDTASHHGSCETYFANKTLEMKVRSQAADLFSYFKYKDCCDGDPHARQ